MNNEEKILSMLENMQNDIKEVKDRLGNVEEKVVATNIMIENEIEPRLKALADGRKMLVERLWDLPDEVEEIKDSVSILKFIQTEMAKSWNK